MSQSRQAIIMDAFRKLDKTGDGIITVADLENAYSVNKHADYLSGRKTKEEILKEFLKNFEIAGHHDGKVIIIQIFHLLEKLIFPRIIFLSGDKGRIYELLFGPQRIGR
jgi:hypothetical protein